MKVLSRMAVKITGMVYIGIPWLEQDIGKFRFRTYLLKMNLFILVISRMPF